MNIVNLTKRSLIIPTSRGPWLAQPAARPAEPEPGTLYVVEEKDLADQNAFWEPVCISLKGGRVRRARTIAYAF